MMRSIRFFVFLIALLSLNACSLAGTTQAQIITPLGTIQVVTTASAPVSVTENPIAEKTSTPTFTISPIEEIITSEEEDDFSMPVTQPITITIIYDNNPYDPRLNSAWGFSALVEYHDHNLLFDTGGVGLVLLENMRILKVDPTRIDSVVLSHAHEDHIGGLTALLDTGTKPVVYLLHSFSDSYKSQIKQYTKVIEVSPGQSFTEGLWTTGEMGGMIPEQALVIQTEYGLVIITGCAHPGIVAIVEHAQDMFAEPVDLVLGGFHLGDKSETAIKEILMDFRRLEVKQVAPCHCTGADAIRLFATEFGEDFLQVGVGSVIRLEK
jgi:7,8-dihydropterin-6-yl-methyl-4-(beta-D-ribofuranosyl)aminobenzene 5'-phosphate synthase